MRRLLFISFFALGCTAFQAPAVAEKIRVAVPTLTANSAFFIVALQKGYYAAEGLDVDAINAAGGISTPALVSGDLQFSLSTGAAISAIVKGAQLKIVMVTQDRPGGEIWSTWPKITSLDDLRGQSVAIQSRGDTGEIALRSLLHRRNLPSDFLSFIPVGTAGAKLAALKSGAFPAALLYWSDIEDLRLAGGSEAAHPVVNLSDQVRMVYNGLVTSDRVLKDRPDLVAKMVRASLEGVAYVRTYRDQSIKLIADYSKLSQEATAFEFDKVIQSARLDNAIDEGLQTDEIALRAELLGMDKASIPQNAAVFDFNVVQHETDALRAENWKPEF